MTLTNMTALLLLALIVLGLVALWREFAAIDRATRLDMPPDEAIANLGDRWVGIVAAVAGVVIFLDVLL